MKSKKPVGCWIVAGVLVLVVIGMISGTIYGLTKLAEKKLEDRAETKPAGELIEEQPLVIKAGRSGELPTGDEPMISIREYLEFSHDRTMTTLTRNAFLEVADGARVDWKMTLIDVNQLDEVLQAGMYVDYLLEGSTEGAPKERKSLAARVLFDPASRGPLLEMARGQRVRFQGILRPLNGNASVEVEDARVITESGK